MSSYHQETAYQRNAMWGHTLDWSHQPFPFKRYHHRLTEPLAEPRMPNAGFFDMALTWPPPANKARQALDARDLSGALLLSAGITAGGSSPAMPGLRASASAGALYPAEIYTTICGLEGIEDGVYHFTPEMPGVHQLWQGSLAAAAAKPLGTSPSQLTFVISTIYWRSLWKYRSRAYRYCLLDAGHMLANLELALAAYGWPPRSIFDFADSSVGVFLGLATEEEGALCAIQAGDKPAEPGPSEPGLPPLDLEMVPLSQRIGRDQQVLSAHAQGYLQDPGPPRQWPGPTVSKRAVTLPVPQTKDIDIVEVIHNRRSRRNFIKGSFDLDALAALLSAALPEAGACQATVLVGPGSELKAGAYDYLPGRNQLAPRQEPADARTALAQASLGQLWVGQAAMSLVLWADLEALAQSGGPRSYRHAMLAAGRAGQRLYLAATALGLGCCGVGAFYDQEVARAASLPPGASPLYLLACGPVKGWPG
ncbi:MAG: SagB/ThcOx family dehydrogenase [Desulfarculaceae bacterium]|jgi:SagB-type dehydrogenase family enzyme